MTKPLLMLMGGADKNIPRAMAEAFAAKVREQGVPVEPHAYDGAPHSFFDRKFGEAPRRLPGPLAQSPRLRVSPFYSNRSERLFC